MLSEIGNHLNIGTLLTQNIRYLCQSSGVSKISENEKVLTISRFHLSLGEEPEIKRQVELASFKEEIFEDTVL